MPPPSSAANTSTAPGPSAAAGPPTTNPPRNSTPSPPPPPQWPQCGDYGEQILAGATLQTLGDDILTATFGKLRVNIATTPQNFQVQMGLISALADELRYSAEGGAAEMWNVMLSHARGATESQVHVWMEVLLEAGRGAGKGAIVPT